MIDDEDEIVRLSPVTLGCGAFVCLAVGLVLGIALLSLAMALMPGPVR